MLKLYIICGLSSATIFTIFNLFAYPSKKSTDPFKKRFSDGVIEFISFAAFGWMSLLFVFVAIYVFVSDNSSENSKSPNVVISLIVFLVLGGILTKCTAPREGATCGDGSYSYATGQGACSWHGGVSSWDKDYWWEDDEVFLTNGRKTALVN